MGFFSGPAARGINCATAGPIGRGRPAPRLHRSTRGAYATELSKKIQTLRSHKRGVQIQLDVMKARQITLALFIALLTSAAGSVVGETPPPEVPDKLPAPIGAKHFGPAVRTEAQCLKLGGSWRIFGMYTKPRCIVPTTDGGKPCTDHSQCQGVCIGPRDAKPGVRTTGVCRDTYNLASTCLVYVSKGVAEPALCVE
jgi:hypothetical protein